MEGVCDCLKDSVTYYLFDHLLYSFIAVYSVCLCHIVYFRTFGSRRHIASIDKG